MASNYTRRITIWINGKEVRNDIASIRSEITKLTNKQSRMIVDSSDYKKAGAEIQRLNNIMAVHREGLKATTTGWGRLKGAAEGMNRYFLMISSAVAGMGGMLMAGKKAISMYAEFDDKVADVKRTTGMAKDEIYAMNESLKKVDTRTAQLELMGLGVIAGKLGIAKKDVEGFITAADKINVALGGALGTDTEEAINQIGKLVDIFKVKEKFGIEESMLKVGSALNDLGNASTASEGYIVEFAKRVGGIAPMVNVSIESVMGLAATLDQLGQTSEVSSTVYSAMITGMFKKTGEYAKIAGMSLKDFNSLLKNNTNEAFIKVLEGMNGNNAGMERMVGLMGDIGMEGKRSVQVLGVLSGNTKLLREQQDVANGSFEKGTSIMNAFNSKNNSAQAILDKARKNMTNMAIELGQKLIPVLTVSTSGFSYFVKAVSVGVDFTLKHGRAIVTTAAAIAAYAIIVKGAAVIETFRNAQTAQGLLMLNLQAIATRVQILITGEATMAQKRLLVAQNAANASAKASVWGLVAAALILVGTAVYSYIKGLNKLTATQEALNRARDKSVELMNDEKSKVDLLVATINNENVSMVTKKKAIEDLKKIIPGYTAMLNDQGKVIYQNTAAVKDYITQLRRQYMLQAYQEEFSKAVLDQAKAQDKVDQLQVQYSGMKGAEKNVSTGGTMTYGSETLTAKGRKKQELADAKKELSETSAVYTAIENKVVSAVNGIDNTKEKIAEAIKMINQYDDVINMSIATKEQKVVAKGERQKWSDIYMGLKYPGKSGSGDPNTGENLGTDNATTELTAEQKSVSDKSAKAAEDAWKQQQSILKSSIEGEIALMEDGYQKELYSLHEKYRQEREATIHELDTNKTLTVEQRASLNDALTNLDAQYVIDTDKLQKEKELKTLQANKKLTTLQLESVREGTKEELDLKLKQLRESEAIELAEVKDNEENRGEIIQAIRDKYNNKRSDEQEKFDLKQLEYSKNATVEEAVKAEEATLNALKVEYEKGNLTRRQYDKQYKEAKQELAQTILNINVKSAQDALDILEASGIASVEAIATARKALADAAKVANEGDAGGVGGDAPKEKGKGFQDMTGGEKGAFAIDAAQQIADTEFQIQRDNNQRMLDDKLSAIGKQRDAELSNKKLTEAQKDAINRKYDAKERALKKAAWQKQHKADIIQAVVSMALAIAKANTLVPPANIPAMVMAGIAGGLQIATIVAQKPPEFYEGGFTRQSGDSRRPAGVVHDNEYVVPEEGLKNPRIRQILNTIEIARLKGSLPTVNPLLASAPVRQMYTGGFSTPQYQQAKATGTHDAAPTTDPVLMEIIRRNTEVMNKLVENGVHTNLSLFDLEKSQAKLTDIRKSTEM